MQGKKSQNHEKACMGAMGMYKFGDNQISFSDFGQPVGMKMNPNNRWVRKAETIPWKECEIRYAHLFKNKKGNVAKPLRLALGACIIQAEYGYSDEETVLQIQENPYLQFFCGFPGYRDERPFDPSLMVYFRKRLTPEILGEINELIVKRAKESEKNVNDHSNDGPSGPKEEPDKAKEPSINEGTLIVDATCAPAHIRYPQDASLLNEAREKTEELIDTLYPQSMLQSKPRTYRKQAHKEYLELARCKHPTSKKIRHAVKKQLSYLSRNIASIQTLLEHGATLTRHQKERFQTIAVLFSQQQYMFMNHTHRVAHRIVSLAQPFLEPIVRGKARTPVEFGPKLEISVVDGWTYLEQYSFRSYNEAHSLKQMVLSFFNRTGHYPRRVLADKIYRTRENLQFCKALGIRLSGPALGRPKKGEIRDKRQDYQDEADRVEVERKFSLAKRKCGLGLIMTKLEDTVSHTLALSVLVLNLRKAVKCHPDLRAWLVWLFLPIRKLGVVQ